MSSTTRLALLFFGASFLLAVGMSGIDMGKGPWYVSRASGLVSFVLLTGSVLGLHAGSLLFDGFLRFTPGDILVPLTSPYRPFWTGLGIIAAWSTAIVTGSFWARKRLRQKTWRRLHYLSFAAWLLSLVHGFTAGTDSQLTPVFWMYVVSAAAVTGLLTYRIGGVIAPAPAPSRARPLPSTAEAR